MKNTSVRILSKHKNKDYKEGHNKPPRSGIFKIRTNSTTSIVKAYDIRYKQNRVGNIVIQAIKQEPESKNYTSETVFYNLPEEQQQILTMKILKIINENSFFIPLS